MNKSNIIVISIKPKWVKEILSGKKDIELRKSFSKELQTNFTAVIYASSPVSAIIGTLKIKSVEVGEVESLWSSLGVRTGATKLEFFDYFNHKKFGVALSISEPKSSEHISLCDLRKNCNFFPPVSWRYLKQVEYEFLKGYLF